MTKTEEIVEELKHTTVAQVIRQVVVVVSVLMPVWLFAGSWIEAYADEAFVKMMTRQGVSPKAFGDIVKKVDEIDKKTDSVKDDLNAVKSQNKELQNQGEDLKSSQDETKKLVEKLLDLQLRRSRRIPGENPQ